MTNQTSPFTYTGDYTLQEYCSASTLVAFATLLNSLLASNSKISGLGERVKTVDPDDEYDFVVIGGGAAGSVVASRLSENRNWRVLLLETGPDESVAAEVPHLSLTLLGTPLDWNYTSTNESYGCLAKSGSCSTSAGKMLGGSTAHNAMLYMRGNPSDFDGWAALGNEGWSFEDVLPFFKKAEDNGEILRVGGKYHSTGGLLSVERMPYHHPFGDSVLAAAVEAGFDLTEDLNGRNNNGFTLMQTTSKNGVRRSSAAAYLRPARNRPNLHISLKTTATKIIIENNTAVGVRYYKNGEFKTVKVKKEVIVSAGNIESPKLLLLSGIGPKEHLESVGVGVVHDLPGVGENFHDQMAYSISFTINQPNTYEWGFNEVLQYIAHQTGPLSGNGITTIRGRVATNMTTYDSPDIRIGVIGYWSGCVTGEENGLRSSGKRTISINAANLHPKSRGRISLASNDSLAYPVIWGNYLSESEDVERLIQGVKLALRLPKTKIMQAYNMTMISEPIEACSDYTWATDDYWTCALRQQATPDIHHAGTCKMGNSSDPMAVVDSKLRVYGIKGLRVADASIMPQVTSSNTGAPTMMIGERAAAFIKEFWNKNEWQPSATRTPAHVPTRTSWRWVKTSSSRFINARPTYAENYRHQYEFYGR